MRKIMKRNTSHTSNTVAALSLPKLDTSPEQNAPHPVVHTGGKNKQNKPQQQQQQQQRGKEKNKNKNNNQKQRLHSDSRRTDRYTVKDFSPRENTTKAYRMLLAAERELR